MTKATWVVVPALAPWRGDMRRNGQPYYIGRGLSWADYNLALFAAAVLRKRGITCFVEILA